MLNDNDFILLNKNNNNEDTSYNYRNIISHRFDASGTLTEDPKLS